MGGAVAAGIERDVATKVGRYHRPQTTGSAWLQVYGARRERADHRYLGCLAGRATKKFGGRRGATHGRGTGRVAANRSGRAGTDVGQRASRCKNAPEIS